MVQWINDKTNFCPLEKLLRQAGRFSPLIPKFESEAGGSQIWSTGEFQDSQGYLVRPCLKNKTNF